MSALPDRRPLPPLRVIDSGETAAEAASDRMILELCRPQGQTEAPTLSRDRRSGSRRVGSAVAGAVVILGLVAATTGIVGFGRGATRAANPGERVVAQIDTVASSLPSPEVTPAPRARVAGPGQARESQEDWAAGLNALREQMRKAADEVASLVPEKLVVASADDQSMIVTPAASDTAETAVSEGPTPIQPSVAIVPERIAATAIRALLERARGLLARGDVAAARLLIERAASGGDAEAVFALAETYDPARLAEWRVRGVRPDVVRARTLYEQALSGGFNDAAMRLSKLK